MLERIAELFVWLFGGFWRLRGRIASCKVEPLRQVYLLVLSSNSKCNTTGPDGLRFCHAKELLHTLE